MTVSKSIIILTLCLFILACNQNQSQEQQVLDANNTIATYTDGNLTIEELKAYIIKQPISNRWSTTDPVEKYKAFISKAIIEKQMLNEAKLTGIEQSHQFKFTHRDEIKKHYTQQYLNSKNVHLSVNDEDIENYYQENISKYNLPEQRYVYHIFKSGLNQNAEPEITAIRKRVLAGENFKLLAKQLSDSESRHNDGFLGKVKRGDFSTEFDDIVFNLELHTPSSVLKSKDGYHLFLITEKLKQKNFQIEEIKNLIHKDILVQLAVEKTKEQALLLPRPEPFFIPDADEFDSILKGKSPQATLYEIGNQKLTVSEFVFLLQKLATKNHNLNIQEKAYLFFQEKAYSEIVYQYMLKENIEYNQTDLLRSKADSLIIEEFSKIKLKSYINKHPELIKEYFNKNRKRYTTPIKLNIQLLMIPITDEINLMPMLEASREKLNNKEIILEELTDKYNGKILISGLMTTQQLAKLNKNIISFAADLEINRHSAPFTSNGHYNIIKLIDKISEKPNLLTVIREKVVNDYIKNYKSQIYIDMTRSYIDKLSIDESVLDLFIQKALIY